MYLLNLSIVKKAGIFEMSHKLQRKRKLSLHDKGVIRDHSQTLVREGLMQKHFIAKIVQGPPSDPKNFRPAPFFAMKITGQPHSKACKLNFYSKICNFFQGPPYKGQKF